MEDTENNLPDLPGGDPDDHIRNLFSKRLSANRSGDVKLGGNVSDVDYEARVNPLTKEFGLKGKTDFGPAKVSGEVQRIGKGTNYSGRVDMGPVNFRGSQSPEGRGIGAGYSKDVGGGRLTADYNRFSPSVGSPGWNANVNYKFDIPVKGWFADGGSVNAQGIASLGRGPDSMLVHMSPREVGGLQQLAMAHGGSLTINPQTGLPEAGFLSNILPIAASVIGSMYGMPWLGAAISGGANYLQTGNLGQSIGKGALSYGLGQIGGNMMDAGATSLSDASGVANVGYEAVSNPDVIQSLANTGSSAAAPTVADWYNTPSAATAAAPAAATAAAPTVADWYNTPSAATAAAPAAAPTVADWYNTPSAAPALAEPAQKMKLYAAEPSTPGPAYTSAAEIRSARPLDSFKAGVSNAYDKGLGAFLTDNKTPLMVAGAGLLGSSMFATPKGVNAPSVNKGNIRPFTYAPGTPNPRYGLPGEPPLIGQGFTAQPIYPAAAGGLMGKADAMFPDDSAKTPDVSGYSIPYLQQLSTDGETAALQTAARDRLFALGVTQRPLKSTYTQHAAHGGLMDLSNEYAAGGRLLQGPGDGMSDSIPAVIKGPKPQRAALAQGEFVIPADVVSHLGNGSTDAGAKRLYSMMDKIRHARTGNKKQGRQINPDKFMPA